MINSIIKFFDRLEDRVRGNLSHYPITYAVISSVGVVLIWRGIWHTADLFPFMTGPVSMIIGLIMLLLTGLFVSFFIGDAILIAGLKREKNWPKKPSKKLKPKRKSSMVYEKPSKRWRAIWKK